MHALFVPEIRNHPRGGLTLALPSSVGDSTRTYSGNFGNDRAAAERALCRAKQSFDFVGQEVALKQLDFVQALFGKAG